MRTFKPDQIRRYHRHLILQNVGSIGQKKLLNSRVLLLGAGGLGSPAALYLAAAGVGTLGIVDFDLVDESNLQRQILHRLSDVGRPKVDSAENTINSINPDVNVVKHRTALHSSNAFEIIEDYDIIVDGTDNFPTRYLINDAATIRGKSVVHGSIFQFDGQATVFKPGAGPVLSLLVSGSTATGCRAELRRSGSLRSAAGYSWHYTSGRGDKARP